MSVHSYEELSQHVGHNIVCVRYGNSNVAVECLDCYEVLIDFDAEESGSI